MEGWMERQVEGWMEGWMDRGMERGEMQKCRLEGGAGTKVASPAKASWISSVVLGLSVCTPFSIREPVESPTASASVLRHRGRVGVTD